MLREFLIKIQLPYVGKFKADLRKLLSKFILFLESKEAKLIID